MKLISTVLLLSAISCNEHLPLKHGVDNFLQETHQFPKIVARDILDIEEEERARDGYGQDGTNGQDGINGKDGDNGKDLSKEIKKLADKIKALEKEKKDVDKDLEDIYDRLECASDAKGLKKTQECLED